MSTPFYDLASLVVVPSGYKASKVYAQKPLTTDGQLTFSRASTATRVNSAGLIETVSSNVPRLDYLGSTCPKLLLEPSRTNVNAFSNDYSNAAYYTNEATRTTGQTDPANGTSATRFLETTVNDNHGFFYVFYNPPTTGTVTQSIFVKDNGRGAVKFGASGQSVSFIFTFATGAISSVTGSPSAYSATQYANGFWRLTLSYGVSAGSPINHTFVYGYNGTTTTYAGDTAKGFLAYGAQFEYGAYPTSLINTTSATVTRLADSASKTSISGLIGQTEGTLFIEVTDWQLALDTVLFSVSDGTLNNYIQISTNSVTGNLQSVIFAGGGGDVLGSTTPTAGQAVKIAVAYKLNDYALYVNGMQIGTLTSKAAPSALTRTDVGSLAWITTGLQPRPKYSQALLFKTRLTNAQLAELTTL
jgi:hypothetical protein